MANRYIEQGGSLIPPTPAVAPHTNRFWSDLTELPTWWFHMVSEELHHAISASGQTPNHTDLTQLRQAMQRLGAGFDPFFRGGPAPSVTNATTVRLPANLCAVDPTTGEMMKAAGNLDVQITASGVNGLDTGSEASNTWYYCWLIKHGTNGTVAGLLSTSSTNPTMPSGYTHKALILPVRNNSSSDFITGACRVWGGGMIEFVYETQHPYSTALAGGLTEAAASLSATSFTAISCAAFVPPQAIFAELATRCSTELTAAFRTTGTAHNGFGTRYSNVDDTFLFPVRLNASQQVDYRVTNGLIAVSVFSWAARIGV